MRSKAREIDKSELENESLQKMMEDMQALLSKEKFGVAIAAPQAGYPIAAFMISGKTFAHAKDEKYDPKKHEDEFFFNPEIVKHSKKIVDSDEGCLSVPLKYSYSVPRYEKVSLRYMDRSGTTKTMNASGFLARVLQHEFDHLQGVLYIDKAKKVIDVDEELRPVNPEDKQYD